MLPGGLSVRNDNPKECSQNKEQKWHREETEAIRRDKKESEENFRHVDDQIPDKPGNI